MIVQLLISSQIFLSLLTTVHGVPIWPIGGVLNPLNSGGSLNDANQPAATGVGRTNNTGAAAAAAHPIRAQSGSTRTQLSSLDDSDYQRDLPLTVSCRNNADCGDETVLFCDEHYGLCDRRRKLYEQCRRDSHCEIGTICLSGKCLPAVLPGRKGSRCGSDADCRSNFCCARQHGEKICKPKLRLYESCYVPKGGLDYSLNESCGCMQNLQCSDVSQSRDPAHRELISYSPPVRDNLFGVWMNVNNLRCLPIST